MKPLNINAEKYVRRLIWESLNHYQNKVSEVFDNQKPGNSGPNYSAHGNSGNNDESQRKELKEKELMDSIRDLISQYFEGYGPMQSDTELMEGK